MKNNYRIIISMILITLMLYNHNPSSGKTATLVIPNTHDLNVVSSNRAYVPLSPSFGVSSVLPIGNKVLFQAYYWEPNNVLVPDNGEWWNALKARVPEWKEAGFDSVWLPPPQKTRLDNIASMGYEPYDYYDLGEYYQKNRTRTRYGTRAELQELISLLNQYGIAAIADIVINHNNGGKDEYNPFVGGMTPTNFMDIASGKFPRNYTAFWPNQYGSGDALAFGNFPDLCHRNPYVHDELIKWGKWLRDYIGFDGWRFDVAVGIEPFMLRDWMLQVGNWGVAEYWILREPSLPLYTFKNQLDYLDATNNTLNAFDFELRLLLRDMTNGGGIFDMRKLNSTGLIWVGRANQAVTVVSNHDTGRDNRVVITTNKHLAYAYILTHEGYPSVYWSDYYNPDLGPHILNLVKIHNQYAKGSTKVLYADEDLYVAQRNGDPGLIIAINDNPSENKSATIYTKWRDTVLTDFTNQIGTVYVDNSGKTQITVPPVSYVILAKGEPFYDYVFSNPYNNATSGDTILEGNIMIDGAFSKEWWGHPVFYDPFGDSSRKQSDLERLYMRHDNEYLYLGIKYGTILETTNQLQLGIAFSTKPGGALTDPYNHPEIHYLASSQKPEYVYYLDTNPDDKWRDFNKATFFSYDSDSQQWNNGTPIPSERFSSDPVTGFLEFKIPLKEIGLEKGGEFSIKVFTTAKNKVAAFDSIPNDITIRGTGDDPSWMKMSDILKLNVDLNEITLPTKQTPVKTNSGFLFFGNTLTISIMFWSLVIIVLKKKKKRITT